MDASTTAKHSRSEQCRKNAREKSEQKRRAAFAALAALQRERKPITKAAVARRAGVSVVFLRSHPDLLQAVEGAEQRQPLAVPEATRSAAAKDQVIGALRRRLDEMKQQVVAQEAVIRQKQREIDCLYGKLAAGSPLTDAELRQKLQDALQRLAHRDKQEEPAG